jgi:phosphate transport system permease protein
MNNLNSETIFKGLLVITASTSIFFVILIFLFIGKEAASLLFDVNPIQLFNPRWIPVSFKEEVFGLIPLITGSILVTITAAVLLIPLGTISAVYISELASVRERKFMKYYIDILAGIPAVVIGFFGLIILSPIIKDIFNLKSGFSALTAALLLVIMALPVVVSYTEEILSSLPISLKEGAAALGAGKLQTILRVTIPAAKSGIISASLLGISRVIGETMIVLMVTGNAAMISLNPFDSVRTLTAAIAAEMGSAPYGSTHYYALFTIGIVLLLITFLLNTSAHKVLNKFKMKYHESEI